MSPSLVSSLGLDCPRRENTWGRERKAALTAGCTGPTQGRGEVAEAAPLVGPSPAGIMAALGSQAGRFGAPSLLAMSLFQAPVREASAHLGLLLSKVRSTCESNRQALMEVLSLWG